MTHRLNLFLVVLGLALGLPYYWLLLENPDRAVPPQPVRLAELRRLADSLPGPRPETITVTVVAWDRSPGTLLAAGAGIKRQLYAVLSFRLEVPGRGPIVIGTGTTPALARARHIEGLHPDRQRMVDADLRSASLIVATDESPEALGGLAALAGTENPATTLSNARLNQAQLPTATRAAGLPWPNRLVIGNTIAGLAPQVLAPGVVVVPTGAPTRGSQMIYVRLADGREYVFAGPVAPYLANISGLRTRARLLDWLDEPHDRPSTMRWLQTLRQWQTEAPGLYIVAGHDIMPLADPKRPSGLRNRE